MNFVNFCLRNLIMLSTLEFIDIKFFIICPYHFLIPMEFVVRWLFISDIGNLYFLHFFMYKLANFINFKESAFCFIGFVVFIFLFH